MPPEPTPTTTVKYLTPLRQAQRDLTRSRIKDAARTLFYERHFDSTTMDEIAVAAGLRRSTLYLHYKDKAEILAEVIADYAPKAKAMLGKLPGPHPSLQQVQRWTAEVAKFTIAEQVPLTIILEVRRNRAYAQVMEDLANSLLEGLGENNPIFREAVAAKNDPLLQARALMLLQEITYVCEFCVLYPGHPTIKGLLEITARDFHDFLSKDQAGKA
jgi:AcrR family transcriptional regulator